MSANLENVEKLIENPSTHHHLLSSENKSQKESNPQKGLEEAIINESTVETILQCIKNGADINKGEKSDGTGMTPLTKSLVRKNEQAAITLIHAGADVNKPSISTVMVDPITVDNYGYLTSPLKYVYVTPLIYAINYNSSSLPSLAELLLLKGASETIDSIDQDGNTALDIALTRHFFQTALVLIFAGADVTKYTSLFKFLTSDQILQFKSKTLPNQKLLSEVSYCLRIIPSLRFCLTDNYLQFLANIIERMYLKQTQNVLLNEKPEVLDELTRSISSEAAILLIQYNEATIWNSIQNKENINKNDIERILTSVLAFRMKMFMQPRTLHTLTHPMPLASSDTLGLSGKPNSKFFTDTAFKIISDLKEMRKTLTEQQKKGSNVNTNANVTQPSVVNVQTVMPFATDKKEKVQKSNPTILDYKLIQEYKVTTEASENQDKLLENQDTVSSSADSNIPSLFTQSSKGLEFVLDMLRKNQVNTNANLSQNFAPTVLLSSPKYNKRSKISKDQANKQNGSTEQVKFHF